MTRRSLPRCGETDVFAEIEPNQKERIILALKRAGQVVGYMGTGSTMRRTARGGRGHLGGQRRGRREARQRTSCCSNRISACWCEGVREGRRTFANTLKYVFMATSANFGNMFSMAGASIFLPFLPLLPKQILLMNVLTDFPEMTIASDRVDPEMYGRPRRWDMHFMRPFMLVFGLVSSVFDYLTFGVLSAARSTPGQFRTGWFVESVASASLIVLVMRSRRPFFKSRPSKLLTLATVTIVVVTAATPHLPFAGALGFQPMPAHFYFVLGLVVLGYVVTAEVAKSLFYRHNKGAQTGANL